MKLSGIYRNVLVISDMHAPYQHQDALQFLEALNKEFKFDLVLSVGDECDFHGSSFHKSNPDLLSPGSELEAAKKVMTKLNKIFPKMYLCESNHGSMILRKAIDADLAKNVIKSYKDIYNTPKWEWDGDFYFSTQLGKVYVCHGKTSAYNKLSTTYGCSTVQGHYHSRAGITYTSTPENLIWDAFTGCLIDKKSLAFSYNKTVKDRPILSVLIINEGIPMIVPMVLNKKGRWIGRI